MTVSTDGTEPIFESQSATPVYNDISSAPVSEDHHRPIDENDLKRLETAGTSASHNIEMSLPHEIAFLCCIAMAQLITQAGLSQVIAPLQIIGAGLGSTTAASLSWYASGYSLTVGTFILPSGRLGDVFGHRKIFLIGWVWLSLWSVIAGLSHYVQLGGLQGNIFFCFCRAMQGIGPSLMLPNGVAILGRTYKPGPRKNMAFASFGAVAPGGAVLGMTFSSLLAERASWEWAFYILGIVAALMAVLCFLVVPEPHAHEFGRTESQVAGGFTAMWTRLDGTGMFLGVAGLVLVNFSWNQGPLVGWGTPYCYFILIIGLLLLVAFFYLEFRHPYPLVPVSHLTRDTSFVLACIACGWSSFGIWIFYTFQYITVERGESGLLGAAEFVPASITGIIAAFTTGYLLGKIRPEIIMLISMCAFTTGITIGGTAPVNQTYWAQTFVSIFVMAFGMDMSFPSGTIIMSNAVPRELQGVAASLVNTVVNYSISIGLGIAGTVESRVNASGDETLKGYQSAFYTGFGLAAMGIVVALLFVSLNLWDEKRGLRAPPAKH